jgi:hypothetical protein
VKVEFALQVGNGTNGFAFNTQRGKGQRFFGFFIDYPSGKRNFLAKAVGANAIMNNNKKTFLM